MTVPALRCAALAAALLTLGCASALQPLDPGSDLGRVDPDLIDPAAAANWNQQAEDLYAARPDTGAVQQAEELWLRAARADPGNPGPILGATRAMTWLARHLESNAARATKSQQAVQTAQWCEVRAPGDPQCSYLLALALGVQANERRSTAKDGLKHMVRQLRITIERNADLDHAGPRRVLAQVLIRAPGWPAGPGDPDSGLEQAEMAAHAFPAYPPNQITLAEAYRAVGRTAASRAAYEKAGDLARQWRDDGYPDAPEWLQDVAAALAELG